MNVASLCGSGTLPHPGGLMDQSAWFISLWQHLEGEESRIKSEQIERKYGN